MLGLRLILLSTVLPVKKIVRPNILFVAFWDDLNDWEVMLGIQTVLRRILIGWLQRGCYQYDSAGNMCCTLRPRVITD